MRTLCFLLIFFKSFNSFSTEIIYSYKGVEDKAIKKNIIHIKNEVDFDVITQVWENERLSKTIKVSKKSDKIYRLKSSSNVYLIGIQPPLRKIVIRK